MESVTVVTGVCVKGKYPEVADLKGRIRAEAKAKSFAVRF
jgi:hypothetical protein